jgi:hypothetical protein
VKATMTEVSKQFSLREIVGSVAASCGFAFGARIDDPLERELHLLRVTLLIERQLLAQEEAFRRQVGPGRESQPDEGDEVLQSAVDHAGGRPTGAHAPLS